MKKKLLKFSTGSFVESFNFSIIKVLFVFFLFACSVQSVFANGAIGYKGIYINSKGTSTWYTAHSVSWGYNGCTNYAFNGATNFSGLNLGTYTTTETLQIAGFGVAGWTDSGDWVAGQLAYKVWRQGTTEPSTYSYLTVGNYGNNGGVANVVCSSGNDRIVGYNNGTLSINPGVAGIYNFKIQAFGRMQYNGGNFNTNDGTEVTATFTVTPTITLGSNPQVCQGTTSASLPYTATSGSPDKYSITFNGAALSAGFASVSNQSLPASPIAITVPGGVATGTYNANLTVTNSTANNVTSSNYPITITVVAALNAGTLSGSQSICSNGTTTFSSTQSGGTWTSGTPAVATINSSTGVITPVAAGTSTMTYTVTGSGCANATATRTVTVTTAPNAGTLSGTQGICSNGTTIFSSNGDTGGTWTSGTPAVATINSSTGVITPVTAGTSTITYTVTGTGGCSNATATRTVTVTALPTAGTLSGTQTICSNGTTTFNSTQSGGAWASGSTGIATINSTTGVITPITTGTATMTYTVTGTGGCANASATRDVTVISSVGGTATASSSAVCLNGNTSISLSGQTGATYQWQRSEDGTNFANISGATLSSYTTPNLVTATSYRASVTNGSCSAANSSAATVTVTANASVAGTTWTTGQNDSTIGFDAWTLTSGGGGGFFAATTSDINNGGSRSWGMYANGSTVGTNFANAVRPVTMNIGNVVSFSMDNGLVTTGSKVGFNLQNSSGQNLMEIFFIGGDAVYKIIDAATQTTTVALLANMASFYAVYHGPAGLKRIATRVHELTKLLAGAVKPLHDSYFDTLVYSPKDVVAVRQRAEAKGINLRYFADGRVGVTFDETVKVQDVQDVADILGEPNPVRGRVSGSEILTRPLTGFGSPSRSRPTILASADPTTSTVALAASSPRTPPLLSTQLRPKPSAPIPSPSRRPRSAAAGAAS